MYVTRPALNVERRNRNLRSAHNTEMRSKLYRIEGLKQVDKIYQVFFW